MVPGLLQLYLSPLVEDSVILIAAEKALPNKTKGPAPREPHPPSETCRAVQSGEEWFR